MMIQVVVFSFFSREIVENTTVCAVRLDKSGWLPYLPSYRGNLDALTVHLEYVVEQLAAVLLCRRSCVTAHSTRRPMRRVGAP